MTSKFSRFITFTLLGFVIFATATVIAVMYEFLSTSMQREYHNELKASQSEVAIMLSDRFNLLELQLKEVSLNNALRVNLMLGLTQQIEEGLGHFNPLTDSTSFYVKETSTSRYIPALPQSYQVLKPILAYPAVLFLHL